MERKLQERKDAGEETDISMLMDPEIPARQSPAPMPKGTDSVPSPMVAASVGSDVFDDMPLD